ncbi:MAG: DUF2867 domain-containing protein [Candidatus Moduliflexus flocculans]|nr:DUF2867 domain-containing protein [Candidatus Moduliflexus flocculans]
MKRRRELFPQIKPIDFRTAVHLALGRIQRDNVETSWSDALVTTAGDIKPYTFTVGRRHVHRAAAGASRPRPRDCFPFLHGHWRRARLAVHGLGVGASAAGWTRQLAASVCGAGGGIPTKSVRASRSISGASNRSSRTASMRLRAEMKLPGKAWLEFKSEPKDGKTLFTVAAYFAPHGLFGFLYWYAMWIPHRFIFDGLTDRLASRACVPAH